MAIRAKRLSSCASRTLRATALALVAAQLVGCASQPTIRSNVDPGADLSRYKTFDFFDAAASGRVAYDSFASRYIKAAVIREMQARGFAQAEDPELLINVHLQSKDKVKVTESPGSYYGYRSGLYGWDVGVSTSVENYTEGTLNVDIVERATSKLLWEGIAVGRVTEKARENLQPTVDAVVKQVFERFPKQP